MKIVFKNKKFIVNEKVVVCIMETCLALTYDQNFGDEAIETNTVLVLSKKRRDMNNQHPAFQTLCFKGIAKCKEGDTFNERTGKIIAEKRAMIKSYGYYKKFFKDCCKELENNLDKFNEFQRNLVNKENYLDTELTSMLMEV